MQKIDPRYWVPRLAALALVLSMGGAAAHAAMLLVDDDLAQCPTATFTTIQNAVDAAVVSGAIRVCPGTYAEQVVISRPVKIIGDNGAIVKPSAVSGVSNVIKANTFANTGVPLDPATRPEHGRADLPRPVQQGVR